MKKFSKIVSALLLSLQVFMTTPLSVLANETHTSNDTEQIQKAKESTTGSSQETSETSATSSEDHSSSTENSTSSSSSTASFESSTTPSSSQSQSKPSESTTPSSETPKQPETPKVTPASAPQVQPKQEAPTPQTAVNQESTADLSQRVPAATVTEDGTIHFEKDESVESFIRKIGESVRKIGKEKDLYASVMIAQAILESGSGQSKLAQAPNYNLFGIKGTHNGKTVSMATEEDLGNGNLYATQAGFRVYEDYEDSFNDYATLLKEGLSGIAQYYSGVWKSNAKTYQEATKFLTGRYATDTKYNQKLNGLIATYDLEQYDKEVQGAPVSAKGYAVPVNNYTVSSPFGGRGGEFHRGLDLAASQGEPIHASKTGTVLKAEYHYSWGNYVVIQHEDGMTTLYAHQQQYVVKAGEKVEQGQIIGYVGTTGNSTGPHLHLEMSRDASQAQSQLIGPASILELK